MKQIFSALTALAIIVFAACSHKATPTKTVMEKPTPKEIPVVVAPVVPKTTYQGAVLTLLQAKCTPCHFPSKGGNKANFESYETAVKYSADMVIRVQMDPGTRGYMPMRNPKLSADEIAILKKWLSDGFQEK